MAAHRRFPAFAAGAKVSHDRGRVLNSPRGLQFETLENRLVLSGMPSPFSELAPPPGPATTILFDTVGQDGVHLEGAVSLAATGGPGWVDTPLLAEDWSTFYRVFAASSGILYREIGYDDQGYNRITEGKTYWVRPNDWNDSCLNSNVDVNVEVTDSPAGDTRVHFVIEPFGDTIFDTVDQNGEHLEGHIHVYGLNDPYWNPSPYVLENWSTFSRTFAASSGILYREINYSDQGYTHITKGKTYWIRPNDWNDSCLDGNADVSVEVTDSPSGETRVHFVIEPFGDAVFDTVDQNGEHLDGHIHVHNLNDPYWNPSPYVVENWSTFSRTFAASSGILYREINYSDQGYTHITKGKTYWIRSNDWNDSCLDGNADVSVEVTDSPNGETRIFFVIEPFGETIFDTVTPSGAHVDGEVNLSVTGGPGAAPTPYAAENWSTFHRVFAHSSGILYREIWYTDQGYQHITKGKTYSVYPLDESDTVVDGMGEAYIEVTDSPGGETRVHFVMFLPNEPPVADAGGPYQVAEGETLVLAGSGDDPDSEDVANLTFTWDLNGDGMFGDATGAAPVLSWQELHELGLGDDGSYTITLRVSDDETSTDSTTELTITNTAPVITEVGLDPAGCGAVRIDDEIVLHASFIDAGLLDTHTAVIDWGDGTTSGGTITQSAGAGTVAARHAYAAGGIYTIVVTVQDDDGGADSETVSSFVTGLRVSDDGELQIVGTNRNDQVLVYRFANTYIVLANFLSGRRYMMFPAAQVDRLFVAVCGGNDHVELAHNILADSQLNGGPGHDTLKGGSGNDNLSGGEGNDRLSGRFGNDVISCGAGHDFAWGGDGDDVLRGDSGNDRLLGMDGDDVLRGDSGADRLWGHCGSDVLVGGDGDDWLNGGSGPDLLIGGNGGDVLHGGHCCGQHRPGDIFVAGSTVHDDNEAVLKTILDDWTSGFSTGLPYAEIVDGLTANWLDPTTSVFDDDAQDRLFGNNKARDLFFARLHPADADADQVKGYWRDAVIEID